MPELLDKLQKQQHQQQLKRMLVNPPLKPQQKQTKQYQQYSQRLHYHHQNLQHQQKYQHQYQCSKCDFFEQEKEAEEERIRQQRKSYNLNTNNNSSKSIKIIITTNKETTTTTTTSKPSSAPTLKPIPASSATSTYNFISSRRLCAAILTLMLTLVCHYSNAQKTSVASIAENFSRNFPQILQEKAQSKRKSTHNIDHSHKNRGRYTHRLNFSATLDEHFELIENRTEQLESLSIVDLEWKKETQLQFIDSQPVFDFGSTRNVTGRTGQSEAVIKCRVDMLNDKSVSWIRKRDLHILTVGTTTYTTDKRFEVSTTKDQREWILHIKAPQARDSGIYECQINTEPKISMAFQLNIIDIPPDAKAIIIGPPDLHFKVGSVIVLQCLVDQPTVKDIGPIYWYRGEQMITPFQQDDNSNNDIDASDSTFLFKAKGAGIATAAVDNANLFGEDSRTMQALTNDITLDFTARIAMESQLGDILKSRLRISNAQTKDTGNYTCQPTTARSASVMVHVINDENPAAMQKSCGTTLSAQTAIVSAIVVFFCCLKLLLACRHKNTKTLNREERALDSAIVAVSLLLMAIVTGTQTSMPLQK